MQVLFIAKYLNVYNYLGCLSLKTDKELMVGLSFKGLYVIIIKTFLHGEHVY